MQCTRIFKTNNETVKHSLQAIIDNLVVQSLTETFLKSIHKNHNNAWYSNAHSLIAQTSLPIISNNNQENYLRISVPKIFVPMGKHWSSLHC